MLFRIYMTSENGYSMVFRKRNISSFILYIISSNSMFEIQNRRNLFFYGVSDDFDYLLMSPLRKVSASKMPFILSLI